MSLRSRLTLAVVAGFSVLLLLGGLVGLEAFERHLRSEQERLTRSVLTAYMGPAGPQDAAAGLTTFYLDEHGQEISQDDLLEMVVAAYDLDALDVDPEDLGTEDGSGTASAVAAPEAPIGEPFVVDRGPEVIALAQHLRLPGGGTYALGVSNPLGEIDAGVAPVRTALLVGGPLIVAAAGLATWWVVGRALGSMEAIRRRAETITSDDLSQRVPVPGRGDEVAALATTVNEMLGRLEDAQTRQQRFISDVSHELRSPVAAAQAQLEVGLADPHRTDWPRTGTVVLGEVETLGSLIDDLFAMSHLDEASPAAPAPTDVASVVRSEAARHEVTEVGAPGELWVLAEEPLLRRAVRNLLDNASRHAAAAVSIAVDRGPGDEVRITVDDDGPGVPVADRDQVFDRFVRLDDARARHDGGAGLGLAIVRGIAERHRGSVTVSESPAGGARFTLVIPQ